MINQLTLPMLLINKLILCGKTILNLNFEVVFLKTIKHALIRFLHGAIHIIGDPLVAVLVSIANLHNSPQQL